MQMICIVSRTRHVRFIVSVLFVHYPLILLTDAQLNNFQQIFDTCCTEIASSQELDLTPQDVSGMLF